MTESEFNRCVDDTMLAIERAIEAARADIDFDTQAGVMTLEFADGSKVIVTRQPPLRQLWLAARSGGYHLDRRDEQWLIASSGERLQDLLSRVCSEQSGADLKLSLS